MKNLAKTIALASTLSFSSFSVANEKLNDYCTEFADLGVTLYENKQKGITFDQAASINKAMYDRGNFSNLTEYEFVSMLIVRFYNQPLTLEKAKEFTFNRCKKLFK